MGMQMEPGSAGQRRRASVLPLGAAAVVALLALFVTAWAAELVAVAALVLTAWLSRRGETDGEAGPDSSAAAPDMVPVEYDVTSDPYGGPAWSEEQPPVPADLVDTVRRLGTDGREAIAALSACADDLQQVTGAVGGALADVHAASRGINVARSSTFQILGQISELGEVSDRITGMVDTIRTIAGQTNLLALNATIEAARAGESGRGFAVVAAEVRKLAQDSRAATESIDAIVGEVRDLTEATIEVASAASEEVEKARALFTAVEESLEQASNGVDGVGSVIDGTSGSVATLSAGLTALASDLEGSRS